ncbi:MAG: ABC transporter ATP-binding protein [Anaerolineae bacterium]|nr:ABC transporter ATP-binding protein [Anaerolineae bacterium]
MIHVRDLCYTYPPTPPATLSVLALDGLNLDVAPGACLAITGPNSSGRTTLCLALAGLAPRLTAGTVSGTILVDGHDVQSVPPGSLADRIGLVLQDPAGQLFTQSVVDEVAWGLENLGLSPAEMPARIDWALGLAGLSGVPLDQPPQTLSGGQQKRLALAAALALEPHVLILDEPSAGLAPAARTEMVAVLRALRESHRLTIVFTESDPEIVTALADEVLVLTAGHGTGAGNPAEVYASAVEQAGLRLPPAARFAAEVRAAGGPELHALTVEQAVEAASSYPIVVRPSPVQAAVSPSRPAAREAVKIDDVHFAYHPDYPVLRGLTLAIPQGQFATLTGDNGAGKTTLARHLVGLLRPQKGIIRLMGEETRRMSTGEMARRVGLAFQNPENQIFSPTVREEVAFGPRNLGLSGTALDDTVRAALAAFGLHDFAEHPPAALTFSTRRLVALAGIAAMDTPVIVLDEPTVGLDAHGQEAVLNWLEQRHAAGATILLITHDMELAASHAERMIVLLDGQIAADGTPGEVFGHRDMLRQAGLEAPFACRFAEMLAEPALIADLTPRGTAQAWLQAIAWKR